MDHFEGTQISSSGGAAQRQAGRRLRVREETSRDRESKTKAQTLLIVPTSPLAAFVTSGISPALPFLTCQLGITTPVLSAPSVIGETKYVAEHHHALRS